MKLAYSKRTCTLTSGKGGGQPYHQLVDTGHVVVSRVGEASAATLGAICVVSRGQCERRRCVRAADEGVIVSLSVCIHQVSKGIPPLVMESNDAAQRRLVLRESRQVLHTGDGRIFRDREDVRRTRGQDGCCIPDDRHIVLANGRLQRADVVSECSITRVSNELRRPGDRVDFLV